MKVLRQSPILDARGNRINHVTVIHNRYEASYPSGTRSWMPGIVQSANKDIDHWSRYEVSRRARYLYKNSPVTRGIINWIVTYVIGTGIKPVPATGSPGWNDVARNIFNDWAARADLQTRNSFWELQRVITQSILLDGDIGTYLTRSTEGRPRLQLLEHQLITGDDLSGRDKWIRDGVEVDTSGRPVRYHVKPNDEANAVPVPEDLMVLHYFVERAGQHRGISILHSAINTIHDLEEICALEKQSVKIHSSNEGVIELAGGMDLEDIFRDTDYETDGTGAVDCDAKQKFYREVLGAETKVLHPGDKYNPLSSDRPSPAWQGFVSHLLDSIALSIGVPPSVLFNQKKGGADTRRDLAAAARSFSRMQQSLSHQFQRIYEHVVYTEWLRGNINVLPNDWRRVNWHFPQSITVDYGRDSKADVENIKMGLDTLENLYGAYGMDWKEQIEQRAREEQFIREMSTRYGINPEDLMMKSVKQMEPEQTNAQNQE